MENRPSATRKSKQIRVVIEALLNKVIHGSQTALQAYQEGKPQTWKAGANEGEALTKLAVTLRCPVADLHVVRRATNDATRRLAEWEKLAPGLLKPQFGFA